MKYFIHDSNQTSLLDDYPIIEAPSPIKAIRQYLKTKQINVEIERSSDIRVQWGVIPAVEYNGKLCIDGSRNKQWYRIKPKLYIPCNKESK